MTGASGAGNTERTLTTNAMGVASMAAEIVASKATTDKVTYIYGASSKNCRKIT